MSFLWMLLVLWLGVTLGYGFLLPRNDAESPLAQKWFDNQHRESSGVSLPRLLWERAVL